jgi:hypothetical protein
VTAALLERLGLTAKEMATLQARFALDSCAALTVADDDHGVPMLLASCGPAVLRFNSVREAEEHLTRIARSYHSG